MAKKRTHTESDTDVILGTLFFDYVFDKPRPDFNDTAALDEWIKTVKGGREYYLQPYPDFKRKRINKIKNPRDEIDVPAPIRLEKGDLLEVFNTVGRGNAAWQGVVAYERKPETSPFTQTQDQKGLTQSQWRAMFALQLPATVLTVDGRIIHGALEPFHEQGMERVAFCVVDYTKSGYEALYELRDGDELTIYNRVYDGVKEMKRELDFDDVVYDESRDYGSFYVYSHDARIMKGITSREVDRTFRKRLPARLTRKKDTQPS